MLKLNETRKLNEQLYFLIYLLFYVVIVALKIMDVLKI